MILIDASVAAKWLMPEVGSEAALDLAEGTEMLFAPTIIRIEVLSAITRRTRRGEATDGESRDRCRKWLGYLDRGAITLAPEGALVDDAMEIALKLKHPLPDCLYLAAANQLRARLITADETFFKRAQGNSTPIEFLAGCTAN